MLSVAGFGAEGAVVATGATLVVVVVELGGMYVGLGHANGGSVVVVCAWVPLLGMDKPKMTTMAIRAAASSCFMGRSYQTLKSARFQIHPPATLDVS